MGSKSARLVFVILLLTALGAGCMSPYSEIPRYDPDNPQFHWLRDRGKSMDGQVAGPALGGGADDADLWVRNRITRVTRIRYRKGVTTLTY